MRIISIIATVLFLFVFVRPGSAQTPTPSPCGVPAYANSAVPTALSALTPNGPMIAYNYPFFNSLGANGQLLFRWMLAHECAHHLNGDVVQAMINPQGYLMITPQVELRADCASAAYLRSIGDLAALNFAIAYWASFGNSSTGPNYPTGLQRAQMLQSC